MENKLVLDFGGTYLKYAVMNYQMEFLEKGKVEAPVQGMTELLSTIDVLFEKYKTQIDGIAVSMAGRIDSKKGFVYRGGAYGFLQNIELQKVISERYHCSTAIINDANAATLAEFVLGNLRDVSSGLSIIIGTGIGAGIIMEGNLLSGSNYNAGELSGLITNAQDGSMYSTFCAKNGTRTLLREYSQIKKIPIEQLDGKLFFKKVLVDKDAEEVLDRFCYHLALQIYNIQCLLDLERVVIGGGISKQELLIEKVLEQSDMIFDKYERFHVEKPEIMACRFHNDSNLYGALLNYQKI